MWMPLPPCAAPQGPWGRPHMACLAATHILVLWSAEGRGCRLVGLQQEGHTQSRGGAGVQEERCRGGCLQVRQPAVPREQPRGGRVSCSGTEAAPPAGLPLSTTRGQHLAKVHVSPLWFQVSLCSYYFRDTVYKLCRNESSVGSGMPVIYRILSAVPGQAWPAAV